MTTVQELAKRYASMFVYDTRNNAKKFIKTIDDRPGELTELIHAAHGDMFPDDWKYEFVYNALELIADASDRKLDSLEEEVESDIYYHELLGWFSSHSDRPCYVDQYVEDYLGSVDGSSFSVMELIGQGQWLEKCEVLRSVLNSLQELVEEMEDEEDEDDDNDDYEEEEE